MITFARTDEQQLLGDTARKFLSDRSDSAAVRATMETDAGVDAALWREAAAMGWAGLLVPEEHGGAGYGLSELAVVMEETGRSLACLPVLSSAVLATSVLLRAGSDKQRAAHLPALAAGETRGALAYLGPSGKPAADEVAVTATASTGGWRLDGESSWVLDGHTADLVIVAATVAGTSDVRLFIVPGDTEGLTRERLETLDQTRPQARLTLDGVTLDSDARLSGDAWSAVEHAVTLAVVAMANEQLGATQRLLEMCTAFAKERKQFGRAIGSFQAIKHRLADMLVDVEAARSTALHSARVADTDDTAELAIAAPLAKAHCSEVFEKAAADAIQIHGGIGFTWEHDAHLYFKRAKTTKLLFGSPAAHRARLADALGL